ncbi:hypothetical protein DH2020_038003 [Rehmannia glutinosa]|uniref:AAA+ ATPase domain-containing protein n=1 Tax=Rehmannia glutinosa TaxID=99300 RepID=A0ABR0V0I1_REHGL
MKPYLSSGTELYRERLVRALAKDLQVPVLVLESSVLPPYLRSPAVENFQEISQTALTAGNSESDEETSDDEETSGSEEDDITSGEESTDCSDDECKSCLSTAKSSEKAVCRLKEGDTFSRSVAICEFFIHNAPILSSGQRGEVHEVNGNKVAIIFFISGLETKEAERDEKSPEPPIHWFDVKHIEHDNDAQMYDCYVAMEVLCQVLESQQPIVVYFSGSFWWLLRAVSKVTREEFFDKVEEMFDHLSGRMILIYGHNKWEAGLPCSLERLIKGLKATYRYEENEIRRLFTNVVYIKPPKEEDLLKTFCKKIEEDKSALISRSNFREMHKILKEHGLLCMDLEHVNTDGVILNKQKAEKIVGWATNHYLSSCHLPSVKENRLHVPHARLKEQEVESKNPSQRLKDLARNKYQRSFISAVVHPGEIGVKFDDVGALEDVKKALNELVILPMKRPELFSHGNLLRVGILLFGPPGTGKTLLAKALATEAGANFLNITPSSIASKVDALLSARGGYTEHDSARKVRNEFMAAWDGLRSKDSQRILILGATNRPFDLDDAVIRRMPRRIYVGLPDVENRLKILKILLAKENLESGFYFEQLAMDTEGYSGSDLKNLCVAAAYRPLQELLEKESKGDRRDGVPALRPLKLDDFINSKVKVGPSVAYNSASLIELREWNEQYGGGSRRKSPFGF